MDIFPILVEDAFSDDVLRQHHGVIGIRKVLSIEGTYFPLIIRRPSNPAGYRRESGSPIHRIHPKGRSASFAAGIGLGPDERGLGKHAINANNHRQRGNQYFRQIIVLPAPRYRRAGDLGPRKHLGRLRRLQGPDPQL
jgi:hypothetical protein